MNKADLINLVESRIGNRRTATAVVESIFDAMIREVADGGKVAITGFGTFEAAQRAPRTGRNPRTGQAVPIGPTVVPRFKAGTTFRAVVADPSRLPSDAGAAGSLVRRAPARTGEPTGSSAPAPAVAKAPDVAAAAGAKKPPKASKDDKSDKSGKSDKARKKKNKKKA